MRSSSVPVSRLLVVWLIFSVIICLSTDGCDTGGGHGVLVTPENAGQGRFLDGPVEGLQYDSPSWTGITEANGTYLYQAGETITFSIGNVTLGTCSTKEIITPLDLVPGAVNTTNPVVINISQFLQSLDLDGNAGNGILITSEMREILKEFSVDFTDPDFENNPQVQLMFDKLNEMEIYPEEQRGLISAEDAQIHLEETLAVIEEEAIAAEEALQNIKFNATIVSPSGHGILIQSQGFSMEGAVVGGTEPYTYLWNFGDGERSSQAEDPGFISYNTPGTYTVSFFVTDATGAMKSDFRYITVWDPATVDPSIYGYPPGWDVPAIVTITSPQETLINVGDDLYLPAVITRGNPPFRYVWGFDSSVVYTWEQDPLDATFTFTESGSHTVSIRLKDSGGDEWNTSLVFEVGGTSD